LEASLASDLFLDSAPVDCNTWQQVDLTIVLLRMVKYKDTVEASPLTKLSMLSSEASFFSRDFGFNDSVTQQQLVLTIGW